MAKREIHLPREEHSSAEILAEAFRLVWEDVRRWMNPQFQREQVIADVAIPDTLSPTALAYLIQYGWKQSHSDAYASAKDEVDFRGKLGKRNDAIVQGKMTPSEPTLGAGRVTDPVEKEYRRLREDDMLAAKRQRKATGKVIGDAWVKWYLGRYDEVYGPETRAKAEKIVAERRAASGETKDLDGFE